MDLKRIKIDDSFWGAYLSLVREVVIPYQHEILWDRVPGVEKSYAVNNFRIAAGEIEGEFGGMVFQDSDLAKWLEAVGYSLTLHPDPELEQQADQIIDYIAAAQQPDGYVNTYYILNGLDKRFTNLLDCHEMYCLGHMIEGAVAYYQGTGKRKLLDVVCRYTDLVDSLFGPEEGKAKGYPGHQEIELALVKLYGATGEQRYLKLARFFLDERGKEPSFFREEYEKRGRTRHWPVFQDLDLAYNQAHLPVREQKEAVGHAVRAVYMYTGMAEVAKETGDESLLEACRVLWDNIVNKQLYVTGGIGQTAMGEAFTFDYDLPNDTVYSETCAAIGLIFFARSMLDAEAKGGYADVMEQALYNTVLAGMARDGKHFFYVNPLEVWPEASEKTPVRHHVRPQRPGWFACACCPPNVARLLSSLGKYAYGQGEDTVYVHLYLGGEAEFDLAGGVKLRQTTEYPWNGKGSIEVEGSGEFTIALRLPGWCGDPAVTVNGESVSTGTAKDGYLYLTRAWSAGDRIGLDFPMPVRFLRAHPAVRANAGKVAVARGPLVYCAEEVDNGSNLSALTLDPAAATAVEQDESLPGGPGNLWFLSIRCKGHRESGAQDSLYRPASCLEKEETPIKLIPYFIWGNRGQEAGEMSVWLRTE